MQTLVSLIDYAGHGSAAGGAIAQNLRRLAKLVARPQGFDTRDLKDAKALVDALVPRVEKGCS